MAANLAESNSAQSEGEPALRNRWRLLPGSTQSKKRWEKIGLFQTDSDL